MVHDDIILNKIDMISRCIRRIHDVYDDTAIRLKRMAGFRNIAVHDYQTIQMEIVVKIIEDHLQDFEQFIKEILAIPTT